MTCVFTGKEEDVAGILAAVDMKGVVTVVDSDYHNYEVAKVTDVIVEVTPDSTTGGQQE